MDNAKDWLITNYSKYKRQLSELVCIPSVSKDAGNDEGRKSMLRCAEAVAELMRQAGLMGVRLISSVSGCPYVYGQWGDNPNVPTVLFYAHYDVQPATNDGWTEPGPWQLGEREGRLYSRGVVDDKGPLIAQLAAIEALLHTRGSLPVNLRMIVEGEEEIGSINFEQFLSAHRDEVAADVVVVCDTDQWQEGVPSITCSLRGLVEMLVEVQTAEAPVHSGIFGGICPDAAITLNVILARLCWENGPVSGIHDDPQIRPTSESESEMLRKLSAEGQDPQTQLRLLPGVRMAYEAGLSHYEQTMRRPAVSIIVQQASSFKTKSNQILDKASAIISYRSVPFQKPEDIMEKMRQLLTANPPWGGRVTVTSTRRPGQWWMMEPQGPFFEAAMAALQEGYGVEPKLIGSGGTIGFVSTIDRVLGRIPQLLMGLIDPLGQVHAPNESLQIDSWHKMMESMVHLLDNLGKIGSQIK